MKGFILIFILSLSALALYAQRQWSDWETVHQAGSYPNDNRVQVSFKLSVCNGEHLRGYSFYRTNVVAKPMQTIC